MSRITAIVAALIILLIVSLAWTVNHYRDNALNYKAQRDQVTSALKLATDTISDMQTRQRDVAALDAKYIKELADANAENTALQHRLDAGGRVLVKGRWPVFTTTEATSTSGMGHDATVELSDIAGRNVLDIRSGIINDQTALRALQEYITTQCLR